MENHKRHTPLGIIVVVFVIIFVTIFLVKENPNQPDQKNDNEQQEVATTPVYRCGMTVVSPLPNSTITFPLTVSGSVNNLAATDGCTWNMFEGYAGSVTVSDAIGAHATIGLTVNGDWTGNVPVTFSGILNPPVVVASGSPLTLTFTEEDPSGENLGTTFSYQVIAQ